MMEVKPSVCTMKKAQSILVNMFFQVKVHDTEAGQCVNADVRDLLQECIWAECVPWMIVAEILSETQAACRRRLYDTSVSC